MLYEVTIVGPLLQVLALVAYAVTSALIQGPKSSVATPITRPEVPIALTPSRWMNGIVWLDVIMLSLSIIYQLNNQMLLPKRIQRVLFHFGVVCGNLLMSTSNIMLMKEENEGASGCCMIGGVATLLGYTTYLLSRRIRTMEEKLKEQEERINYRVVRYALMNMPISIHATLQLFTALVLPLQNSMGGETAQIISELAFLAFITGGFFGFKDIMCVCTSMVLILAQVSRIISTADINVPWTIPEYAVLGSFILITLFSVTGLTFDIVHVIQSFKKQHTDEKIDVEWRKSKNINYNIKENIDESTEEANSDISNATLSCDIENWKKEGVCEVQKMPTYSPTN